MICRLRMRRKEVGSTEDAFRRDGQTTLFVDILGDAGGEDGWMRRWW